MFYFGLRSSATYLRNLAEVRELREPHHLLSVIGGFAFLHGLAPGCRSLTLVDVDPDAADHWRLVRALLLEAGSLGDFITLLSGWQTSGSYTEPGGLFTAPLDLGARLDAVLEPQLRDLYARTYGAIVIDPKGNEGRIGHARVKFTGFDLAIETFCWQFGTGNFADEEKFAWLQDALRRLPERTLIAGLEEFDYGRQPWHAGEQVVFLASNCESPMFTRGDAVLRRVLATARADVRYISWFRDFRIAVPEQPADTRTDLLARLGEWPASVLHLAEPGASSAPLAGLREERSFTATHEVLGLTEYGRPLLVIEGGRWRDVVDLLTAIAPTFERVLWLRDRRWFWRRFPRDLRSSYRITTTRSSLTVGFTLRGLRDESAARGRA